MIKRSESKCSGTWQVAYLQVVWYDFDRDSNCRNGFGKVARCQITAVMGVLLDYPHFLAGIAVISKVIAVMGN